MSGCDWSALGVELREAARGAHEGKLPAVSVAYYFLLDNPECFGRGDQWPEEMPASPPPGLAAAYYKGQTDRGTVHLVLAAIILAGLVAFFVGGWIGVWCV